MKIFHDIIFEATADGDDTPIISDAYQGDFDLENDAGDKDFKLTFSVVGKKVWYDEEEGEVISDQAYEDKDDKSCCESTYDIVHTYLLEDLELSTVKYNKAVKTYMKSCMKALPKGPVKKAIKTHAKKFATKDAGGFYNYCKSNSDNMVYYARQGTEPAARKGEAMIIVADMSDWKAPTFYWFGAGLQGKNV